MLYFSSKYFLRWALRWVICVGGTGALVGCELLRLVATISTSSSSVRRLASKLATKCVFSSEKLVLWGIGSVFGYALSIVGVEVATGEIEVLLGVWTWLLALTTLLLGSLKLGGGVELLIGKELGVLVLQTLLLFCC